MDVTPRAVPRSSPSSGFLFLSRFLTDARRVASIAPSSRWLARAACRHVDRSKPQTIVELGAGTGAVTAVACAKMHPRSRLIAVEVDPVFARELALACPRAEVIRCDAAHWDRALDALGVDRVDVLLNGLPTPSLPRSVNRPVFDAFARRSPDAWFSQLTVMPWVYLPMYRRLFREVRFELAALNLPPGGAYHCRGLVPDYSDALPGGD